MARAHHFLKSQPAQRKRLDQCQHFFQMFVGLHLGQDGFDLAVAADDEGAALDAHVDLSIHVFLHPHAVGLDDVAVVIAEQGKGQVVLFDELLVALDRVEADAEDLCLGGDFLPGIPQVTGLGGAAGGVVFRIEIEHDGVARQIGEFDGGGRSIVAADGLGGKCGSFGAGLWLGTHGICDDLRKQ